MKRRMIAQEIISEGKFLRMSLTAQALYMHLLANADDDGCVDAYTVTRMIGAKEDDLVLLKEREYIVILDEKEYILWISGWQDFNWIDARYKEDSKYLPLLRAKVEGLEIVESTKKEYNRGRYARRKLEREVGDSSAHVQLMGGTRDAHVDTPLRIDKDSKDKNTNAASPQPKASGENLGKSPGKGSMDSVTTEAMQAISESYNVSRKDVDVTWEKLRLWCGAKGRTYKDYSLALQSWVRSEIEKGNVRKLPIQEANPYVEPAPVSSRYDTEKIRRDLAERFGM